LITTKTTHWHIMEMVFPVFALSTAVGLNAGLERRLPSMLRNCQSNKPFVIMDGAMIPVIVVALTFERFEHDLKSFERVKYKVHKPPLSTPYNQ
jgi:hypothetical protein